ncbi:MAG: sensor histidine kinase [Mycobacteriales bacterium]
MSIGDGPVDGAGRTPGFGRRENASGGWYLAPRLARVLVTTVLSGLVLVAVLTILASPITDGQKALGVVYLLAMLLLQLRFLRRRTPPVTSPRGFLALLAQAVLAYLPFVQFGQSWIAMPGFLAGAFLLSLPRVAAWLAFAAVVASVALIQDELTASWYHSSYAAISTVITGLLVYGLTRLAALVTDLREARAEIARLAVVQERLRMSRDLHDLLGYSISAIALKSELAHRLVLANPQRAQQEVADIQEISRAALADVRSVALGYRSLSLQDEAVSARSMLLAADVDVTVDLSGAEGLPPEVGTVLAIVLREGVTNVLRHSKARRCEISVRRSRSAVHLDLVNDGIADGGPHHPQGGAGVDNLSSRVADLGGELEAGEDGEGRWRLRVTVPVPGS